MRKLAARCAVICRLDDIPVSTVTCADLCRSRTPTAEIPPEMLSDAEREIVCTDVPVPADAMLPSTDTDEDLSNSLVCRAVGPAEIEKEEVRNSSLCPCVLSPAISVMEADRNAAPPPSEPIAEDRDNDEERNTVLNPDTEIPPLSENDAAPKTVLAPEAAIAP